MRNILQSTVRMINETHARSNFDKLGYAHLYVESIGETPEGTIYVCYGPEDDLKDHGG